MRELLFSVTKKDLDIQTKRGSGPGGQHRNKTDSAVRIVHRESGAVGECSESRSQGDNKKTAFVRMTETFKFKQWHALKTKEILSGKTLLQEVCEAMTQDKLKVETFDKKNKKWIMESN